jgi:hypothetical protein
MNNFNSARGLRSNVCLLLLAIGSLGLFPNVAHGQLFGKRGGDDKAAAQIDGDTIKIAPGKSSFLKVIGPVRSINPLSEDYGYTCTEGTGNIYLRAKSSNPEKFSQLIVNEGTEGAVRQHIFVLQFVKSMDLKEQTHDISSIEKIRDRIAYLEKAKAAPAGEPAADEEVEKPKVAAKKPAVEKPKVTKPAAEKPEKGPKGRKETASAKPKKSDEEEDSETPNKATARANPTSSNSSRGGEKVVGQVYKSDGEIERKSIASDDVIANIPPEVLAKRVKVTIDRFYHHCTELSAKRSIEMNTRECMKLFNNDTSVSVERTNARTNARRRDKIRRYLRNLTQLSYTTGEITAANINFISGEARKGPDGKYHATAVVMQDFKGFKDDIIVYQDQTTKTIEIILDVFEAMKDGKRVEVLQVFLGDISVSDQN